MKIIDERFGMVLKADRNGLIVSWTPLPPQHEREAQRIMATTYLMQSLIKYCLIGEFK